MDFELIENLSDRDVIELFESQISDTNSTLISFCYCWDSNHNYEPGITWDSGMPGWGDCRYMPRSSFECAQHCVSHGLTQAGNGFYSSCYCIAFFGYSRVWTGRESGKANCPDYNT